MKFPPVAVMIAVSVLAGCAPEAVSSAAPAQKATAAAQKPAGLQVLPEGLSENSVALELSTVILSPTPVDRLPDINYMNSAADLPSAVNWQVRYEFADSRSSINGIINRVTINGAPRSMAIASGKGVITGEDASWHTTVLLFAKMQQLKGTGTLRFALFHPEVVDDKGNFLDAGRISNWLTMPVSFNR
ncbi:MAG: hypothetical protein JW909_10105 [Planctomycetes bacterium]|nr:hypothetical protein [Planctomycetota bacterium]